MKVTVVRLELQALLMRHYKGLIFQANVMEYYYSRALQNIMRFTYSPNKAIDETSRFQPLLKKILYL
jgi:hypothetical protein